MSTRIVVVGGGISGLSIAARLAQAGLPVTVLESSDLGVGASTRNQGWLFSGGWFAPEQLELARMCYESLQQTLWFCPECVEPDTGSMVYLLQNAATESSRWTSAWQAAGIPHESVTAESLCERFPGMAFRGQQAFELPDRAIRPDLLLRRLADAAQEAGAEIRTSTAVSRLSQVRDSVQGVETVDGELIRARLVILAGNAKGGFLFPGYGAGTVGEQAEVALVVLKTHLVALQPEVSRWPLCVVDVGGFNHIPHPPYSVFGSNRWLHVRHGDNDQIGAIEIELIWNHVRQFFPTVRRDNQAVEWAGTTAQAMHVAQIKSGGQPLPTVIDHERETPSVKNLLSVFPGRASLWPHLAEQARLTVLRKLESIATRIAVPPWGNQTGRWV